MSELANKLREENEATTALARQIEEMLRVQALVTQLFLKRDEESQSKQRVVRIALGMKE